MNMDDGERLARELNELDRMAHGLFCRQLPETLATASFFTARSGQNSASVSFSEAPASGRRYRLHLGSVSV